MMLCIPEVLTREEVAGCRRILEQAAWSDGSETAGHAARKVKNNLQLAPGHEATARLEELVLEKLPKSPLFMSAALPLKVLPPRFNRYEGGGNYGSHVDAAVLSIPGTPHRIRSDISATLFFSDPQEYDGGELEVADLYGTHKVKLPAGHMVVYPGSSVHRVTPVTRGTRFASFFWVQSLVREDERRTLLFELDASIRQLTTAVPDDPALTRLIAVYHNLLRQWSET